VSAAERASIDGLIAGLIKTKGDGKGAYSPEARAAEEGVMLTLLSGALQDLNRLADAAEAPVVTARGPNIAMAAGVDEQKAITEFVGWLTTRPTTAKIGASYPAPGAFDLVNEYMGVKNGR
jgi:hypothetical protein